MLYEFCFSYVPKNYYSKVISIFLLLELPSLNFLQAPPLRIIPRQTSTKIFEPFQLLHNASLNSAISCIYNTHIYNFWFCTI